MRDQLSRSHHAPVEPLPIHRHRHAFVALVDRGGYLELSADGVYRCEPDMAILHPPFHQHANQFLQPEVVVTNVVVPAVSKYRVLRLSSGQARDARRASSPSELLDLLSCCQAESPSELPPVVLSAVESLRSNPHQKIGEVASALDLSPEHLARVFKRFTGMSPTTFRSEQRLQRALADLAAKTPAASVAHRWGYSDQSHLCREVKTATGLTVGGLQRSDFFKTVSPGSH